MRWTPLLVELGLALAPLVSSQAPQDPIKDFCRRFSQQTAVIDRKLYIDGGYVNADPLSQNPQAAINQGLLYQNLDVLSQGGMPQLYANLSKNSTIPDVAGGILWADTVNQIFYLYGGEYSAVPQPLSFWGYDAILNQWNKSSTPPNTIDWVSWGAGTTVNARGEGYYYGGYLNNLTTPGWSGLSLATNGLIKYDMVQNYWTNNTGPDDIGRAEGVMVTVPASSQGLLIYFGGVEFPYGNGSEAPSPMDTIYVFDIAESKWYAQTATGNVPANRRKFCAGSTWAQDQSSYNIYLYGGAGFTENITGFDDVYILTMPAFEWIKWYPTASTSTAYPHNSLTCNVIDNAQMLIIGGTFPNSTMCDAPDVWGTHNLDLGKNNVNSSEWILFNPNLTSYIVPPEIIAVVGGNKNGSATVTAPSSGWGDNVDLAVYFTQTATYAVRTPTRSIPTTTGVVPPPTPSPIPGKHNSNAAIIGGAVGGGVAVILLALVLLCCGVRQYRRRRLEQQQSSHAPLYQQNSEMQGQHVLPSELAGRNSCTTESYAPHTSNGYYEQKHLSPTPTSPPTNSTSPVHSYNNALSPQSMNPNSLPMQPGGYPSGQDNVGYAHVPGRTTSPTYQHPAHQTPGQQEYFPPPLMKTSAMAGSPRSAVVSGGGRSYELSASRSPEPASWPRNELPAPRGGSDGSHVS